MFVPFLYDFIYTPLHVFTKLVGPKSDDFPTMTLELDVAPNVIYFARAVGISVAVSVHLYVNFMRYIPFPDKT